LLHSLRSVASLLVGAGILTLGSSLLGIVLPMRMGMAELSDAVIGLVMSGYFVGFILGCIFGPRLTGRIGHVRAFAAFAAVISAAALLHALWFGALPWALLRIVSGFCMAGLFNVIESWLNLRSTVETRGQILSLYLVTTSLTWGGGQFLVNAWEVSSFELFCLAALLLTVSLVPLVLTRVANPEFGEPQRLSFAELYGLSPLGVIGAYGSGLGGGAFFAMAPLFGLKENLTPFEISLLLGLPVFGGLILQWPIGRLSDRFDRRTVLLAMLAVETVVCLLMFGDWMLLDSLVPLLILATLFGAAHATVYPLSVAHAFDYVAPNRMVSASSGLLLAWAIGAMKGPILASWAMGLLGDAGLFLYLAVIAAALAGFTRYRMTRRAARPPEEQSTFVALPTTAPAAGHLDPRAAPADEALPLLAHDVDEGERR